MKVTIKNKKIKLFSQEKFYFDYRIFDFHSVLHMKVNRTHQTWPHDYPQPRTEATDKWQVGPEVFTLLVI